jgi:uncharacterized membrane protein YkvA (DUF1232 family)
MSVMTTHFEKREGSQPPRGFVDLWKQKAKALKKEVFALYLAYKDPRVPWYAKVFSAVVVGYAFSPIDLIPDPIPVLGYLDDLVLIPLGIALAMKMIPGEVMADCRIKAEEMAAQGKPVNRVAAAVIILIWIAVFIWTFGWVKRLIAR